MHFMDPAVRQKVEAFFHRFPSQHFARSQHLLTPIHPSSSIFYLASGLVRQYSNSFDGQELTLNQFRPPSFFPLGPLVNATKNRFNYQATSDSVVFVAPAKDTLDFLTSNPDVMFDLIKRIYSGLDGYFLIVESLLSGNAYYKTVTHLLLHARRFGPDQQITHSQIASLAGLSRETVTREIAKLKKKKLVSYTKSILQVADPTRLEQELLS